MTRIEAFTDADFADVADFIAALQDYERTLASELKSGAEVGTSHMHHVIRMTTERNGIILLARSDTRTVGFVSAWVEHDDDPLLREDVRDYVLVSDLFVAPECRRQGIASELLAAVERTMLARGCTRIRLYAKAANGAALACYEDAGYRRSEVRLTKSVGP